MSDDLRQRYAEAIAKAAGSAAFETSDPAWDGFRALWYVYVDAALAVRDAELESLRAAVARVRRLCDLTIAASCRVEAINQARDILAVLDDSKADVREAG